MDKYKLKLKKENLSYYQLKEVVELVLELLTQNLEIDEAKIPNSIKRHFEKIK
jgi:hypothetical protein